MFILFVNESGTSKKTPRLISVSSPRKSNCFVYDAKFKTKETSQILVIRKITILQQMMHVVVFFS